jgi:hypothetical protein
MTSVYKYRIKCITDNTFETTWDTEEPTTCPINTAHTIDSSQTSIIDNIIQNELIVKEEEISTGGNFSTTTIFVDAKKNTTSNTIMSWEHPVTALSVSFVGETTHQGDIINLVSGKDIVIGVLTANITQSTIWTTQNYTVDSVVTYNTKTYTCITNTVSNENPTDTVYWKRGFGLHVSQTVTDNTKVGFYISVYDGTNDDSLGYVISIDKINNKIYLTTDLTSASFSATTPSYIRQSVYTIRDYTVGPAWYHVIGNSKIGGSYIPAGVEVNLLYTNKSLDTDKGFYGTVEYLY